MSSTVNSYLKALLALSEDKTLESSRRSLLQSLSDADLQRVVQHGVGREFARGALEDIAVAILDVIVRDPQANYKVGGTQDGWVEVKKEAVNDEVVGGEDSDDITVLVPEETQQSTDVMETPLEKQVTETQRNSHRDSQPLVHDTGPTIPHRSSIESSKGKRRSGASMDLGSVRKRAMKSPSVIAGAPQPEIPTRSASTANTTTTTPSPLPKESCNSQQPRVFTPLQNEVPRITYPLNYDELTHTTAAELVELIHTDVIFSNIKSTYDTVYPLSNLASILAETRIYFWFPRENLDSRTIGKSAGHPTTAPTTLPRDFHVAVCEKFCSNYLNDDIKQRTYRRMLKNRDKISNVGMCYTNYDKWPRMSPSPRSMGGADLETACDECISRRKLCTRFVKVRGELVLAIFPLPVALRAGKQWTDLTCWVQEW
ncbi:hypothetical protein GMOD_00006601 [Pyrenophora seminiperda CCB06]|uniref:Uncharacterized protein n=1 Tax=Pyrenophora seminiperda CCB06 TaxID=1302712 RepID=A0A3M7MAC8_9PLEO|nr:hypothetical protein GMOD_00006601 [Pyrenophora seminiperda CCB06]